MKSATEKDIWISLAWAPIILVRFLGACLLWMTSKTNEIKSNSTIEEKSL